MLPTEREICPIPEDLDGQVAVENYLGRSLGEAEKQIRENSLYYVGDFLWMGPVAFRYYLPAVTAYLLSEYSTQDPDVVNSLLSTIEIRMGQEPVEFLETKGVVLPVLDAIVGNYSKFEIPQSIYGDLLAKARALRQKLADDMK